MSIARWYERVVQTWSFRCRVLSRHPATHVHYFRCAVPEDLRALVGKREEKRSLGTKDPEEAKVRHAIAAAQIDARWRELRCGVQKLNHRQAYAIAGEFYRDLIGQFEDRPLRKERHAEAGAINAGMEDGTAFSLAPLPTIAEQGNFAEAMSGNDDAILAFLDRRGTRVDRESFGLVRKAVASALAQGHGVLARFASGDYRPDPDAARFPPAIAIAPKPEPLTSTTLFDRYNAEAQVAAATEKRWRGVFKALVKFLGHDDMSALTEDDVLRWKRALLEEGLSTRTVRYVNLAALNTVLKFAVREKMLAANPSGSVSVTVRKAPRTRSKGFTADEALKILRATVDPASKRTSVEFAAARRWVPWLCAYSGARVNEITQLRASDIHVVKSGGEDIHVMRITPEAGSVKNKQYRDVALHPHLIEMGFLEYVRKRKGRHLFYDPVRRRGGGPGSPHYKKVGEKLAAWVREIGVTDPAVQPNHGWRHRFNSVCRDAGIDPEIRDMISGHAPRTVGEEYGDLWHHVMAREVARLPRYDLV